MSYNAWRRLVRSLSTKKARTIRNADRRLNYRPGFEFLEGRIAPATNITIILGAIGSGTQDGTFLFNNGQLLFSAPNIGANTLSTGALASIAASNNIVVQATNQITFNNINTLNLLTGPANSVSFSTAIAGGQAITFANNANTLTTAGGDLNFTAGTNLTVGNLNTNGGDVNLTAGASAAGNLSARTIFTAGSGNITLAATNGSGGTITQTGVAAGLAISATATGNATVDGLRGTSVGLVSNTGSVASLGSAPVQASSELSVSAATGITLFTMAFSLEASNSTSGNVNITQVASPAQTLTIVGTGVSNSAASGTVTINNLGASIAISVGVGVGSNNGTITLAALDFQIAGTINSGTAKTILANSTAGRQIDLGTNTAGKIGLTQAELNNVTAAILQIGSATAGNINVSAVITNPATWNTLTLVNGASITEAAAGSLTAPNLRVSSTGPVTLNSANNVGTLAASTTNSFSFNNGTNSLTIGIVDGVTGIVTANSAVTLTADNLNIAQQINAGAGIVTLQPFTITQIINLGGADAAGTLGLTDTELGEVTAGVLRIGNSSNTAGITISSAITRHAGYNTLDLITGTTVGQTAALSVANLAVQATGNITLTNAGNDADTLAVAGGGSVQYTDTNALTVGTVDSVSGVTAATNATLITGLGLTINQAVVAAGILGLSDGGAVTQGAGNGARVQGTALEVLGSGPVTLTNPNNAFAALAANVTGAFSYTNAGTLTVSTVVALGLPSASGVTTSNAALTVATVAGDLALANTVSAGNGAVALTAGSTVASPDHLLTNTVLVTGGSATLTADRMALDTGTINVGSGAANFVTLQSSTLARPVNLDNTAGDPNGELRLSQTELNTITAGAVRIGRIDDVADLTVKSVITNPAGWNTLHLIAGANMVQSGVGTFDVPNLAAQAGGGVGLSTVPSTVTTLAGSAGVSSFLFANTGSLTVGTVDGVVGITTVNPGFSITLTVNGAGNLLTINQPLTSGGSNVFLTADNMALNNNSPSSTINAGTNGILTLTPFTSANTIAVGGADAAGTLGIDDNDLTNVTAKVVRIGSAAQTGAIVVGGTINTHPGYSTMDLIANGALGAITQTTGSIAVANLALQADAGIGSASAIQVVGPINLAFHNVTSNKVQITSTGALTIASVDGLTTSSNAASGGTTTLTSNSPLTFAVTTTSSGTLTATTIETASESGTPLPPPDDNITVNANVTVESTGGDVNFTSGDGIVTATGSLLKSDTGAVNLTVGMGDNDNDATLQLGGSISAGNVTITSPGDICVGGITATGTVSITSINGAILDCSDPNPDPGDTSIDITATNLSLSASTGIGIVSGAGTGPIETQISNLVANTVTGGIFLSNTGNLTIGFSGDTIRGVRDTGASGAIVLTNAGSINVTTNTVANEVISAPGAVTVTATGASADITTGESQNNLGNPTNALKGSIVSVNGTVTLTAGRDLLLGNPAVMFTSGNVLSGGSLVLNAGRNISIDSFSFVFASAFSSNASATITATASAPSVPTAVAGGNITLGQAAGVGSRMATQGGAITLTTGAGGTFTANSGGAGGDVQSNGGAITVIADLVALTDTKSLVAGAGIVTITPFTSGRAITLGTTVTSTLSLLQTDLNHVTAGILRIGSAAAGSITVTAAIAAPAGWSTLSLLSSGAVTQPGGSLAVTSLYVDGAGGVTLTNPSNAVTNLSGNTDGLTSFFGTGNPDGRMATASRPDSPSGIEIESADDFIVNSTTQLAGATFTGLLPSGTPLGSVRQVIVEIYRVFPLDSAPFDNKVPTRVNSPSDVAFDSRDSAAGGLIFSGAVLSASFMASNSVVNVPIPTPPPSGGLPTGGEGAVTGEEVQFTTTFTTPFNLPAGHYFFVPQVQLTNGNFLWLSAPKPIVAPGTPFSPDLQEWIRNANLDPDWLRVGTDIVGGATPPTFNGTFSLDVLAPTNAAFQFTDSTGLTVSTVDGVAGVNTGGAILLQSSVANSLLTVNQAVTTNGGGNTTFSFDNMTLSAGVSAAGHRVTLQPFSNGQLINLGGADAVGTLGLTNAELNEVTAGTLQVGNGACSIITVTAAIAPSLVTTLVLENAAAVSEPAAGDTITVPNLAIFCFGGPVTMNQANGVTTLAAIVPVTGQSFSFADAGSLTIGTVDGLSGVTTSNPGDITITAGTDLTVNRPVRGPGANVNLESGANNAGSNFRINAAITSPFGSVTLSAGNGANDFIFAAGITLNGKVVGGSGSDTIDWSAYATGLHVTATALGTVDGIKGTESASGVTFDNMENIIGPVGPTNMFTDSVAPPGTLTPGNPEVYTNSGRTLNLFNFLPVIPANNVTITYSAGNLTITGDNLTNSIIISQTSANQITISRGAIGTTFTFNGQSGLTGPITVNNVMNMSIGMGNGDDTVSFNYATQSISLSGNVSITGGTGNRQILTSAAATTLFTVNGSLTMSKSTGNEVVRFTNLHVGNSVSMTNSTGNNSVTLNTIGAGVMGTIGTSLFINDGAGYDTTTLTNTSVGTTTQIIHGTPATLIAGQFDLLSIQGDSFHGQFTFTGGSVDTTANVQTTSGSTTFSGNVLMSFGTRNDTLNLATGGQVALLGGSSTFNGGAGSNTLNKVDANISFNFPPSFTNW